MLPGKLWAGRQSGFFCGEKSSGINLLLFPAVLSTELDTMARKDSEEIDRLVSLAQQGDRQAFSGLVRLLVNDVVALTYRMTGDRDVAHDLAQDAFVAAWQGLGDFRGEARFENWLYRIASNKTLNYLSKASTVRSTSLEQSLQIQDTEPDSGPAPDRQLAQQQLREGVLAFMQTLPPQQRVVFELRFYRQLDFGEIAEVTGKALGTVKTHYREAVAKLRAAAVKKGWRS